VGVFVARFLRSLVGNVSKKSENDEIIEQILKLRVKAVEERLDQCSPARLIP
jgi:hypothetical protein